MYIIIIIGQTIGDFFLQTILEMSFEFKCNEQCPVGECSIIKIGTSYSDRVPLIMIPSSTQGLEIQFTNYLGQHIGYSINDIYLKNRMIDGNYHKYYFKWSSTERIFIFDNNITYMNETDGSYNSNGFVYKLQEIYIIEDGSTITAIDGYIKNIWINTSLSEQYNGPRLITDPPTKSPIEYTVDSCNGITNCWRIKDKIFINNGLNNWQSIFAIPPIAYFNNTIYIINNINTFKISYSNIDNNIDIIK